MRRRKDDKNDVTKGDCAKQGFGEGGTKLSRQFLYNRKQFVWWCGGTTLSRTSSLLTVVEPSSQHGPLLTLSKGAGLRFSEAPTSHVSQQCGASFHLVLHPPSVPRPGLSAGRTPPVSRLRGRRPRLGWRATMPRSDGRWPGPADRPPPGRRPNDVGWRESNWSRVPFGSSLFFGLELEVSPLKRTWGQGE